MRTDRGVSMLAIIFILAVLVGGGYMLVQEFKVGSFKEKMKEDVMVTDYQRLTTEKVPANWKTYQDEEYGFEFRYPSSVARSERSGNGWLVVRLVGAGYELYLQVGPKQSPLPDVFLSSEKTVSLAGNIFQEGTARSDKNPRLGLSEGMQWIQFIGIHNFVAFGWLEENRNVEIINEIHSILNTTRLYE